MSYKAIDVAEFILDYANKNNKEITNMKLQKILYYLQGFSYKYRGIELFEEDIEAWPYGPVIRNVYIEFSWYGSNHIPFSYNCEKNPKSYFGFEVYNFLENVIKMLIDYTAIELMNATHTEESPWSLTYTDNQKLVIPKNMIQEYFERD